MVGTPSHKERDHGPSRRCKGRTHFSWLDDLERVGGVKGKMEGDSLSKVESIIKGSLDPACAIATQKQKNKSHYIKTYNH